MKIDTLRNDLFAQILEIQLDTNPQLRVYVLTSLFVPQRNYLHPVPLSPPLYFGGMKLGLLEEIVIGCPEMPLSESVVPNYWFDLRR